MFGLVWFSYPPGARPPQRAPSLSLNPQSRGEGPPASEYSSDARRIADSITSWPLLPAFFSTIMMHGSKMWASKSHIPLIWGRQIEQHPCNPNDEIPKQRDHVQIGFFDNVFLVQYIILIRTHVRHNILVHGRVVHCLSQVELKRGRKSELCSIDTNCSKNQEHMIQIPFLAINSKLFLFRLYKELVFPFFNKTCRYRSLL